MKRPTATDTHNVIQEKDIHLHSLNFKCTRKTFRKLKVLKVQGGVVLLDFFKKDSQTRQTIFH